MKPPEAKILHIKELVRHSIPGFVEKKSPDDEFWLKIYDLLYGEKFPLTKRAARVLLSTLLQCLPQGAEIQLLNFLKKLNMKERARTYLEPLTFSLYRHLEPVSDPGSYPDRKYFYLGLSFDIDNKIDYENLPVLIEDMKKNGIRATINIITHGNYDFDKGWMRELQSNGFEIGLHGDDHNSSLSFLPKRVIEHKIRRAIDKLGFVPAGYRSPALSFSNTLIEVLEKTGFAYDSSLSTCLAMYRSIEFPYAFKYMSSTLYEVPLCIQDYNFFASGRYAEQEVMNIYRELIRQMHQIRGLALINLHPIIISKKILFWEGLLSLMEEYKSLSSQATVSDLVRDLKKRAAY